MLSPGQSMSKRTINFEDAQTVGLQHGYSGGNGNGSGDGYGNGNGYCYGYGDGDGYGNGDGYCYGWQSLGGLTKVGNEKDILRRWS